MKLYYAYPCRDINVCLKTYKVLHPDLESVPFPKFCLDNCLGCPDSCDYPISYKDSGNNDRILFLPDEPFHE